MASLVLVQQIYGRTSDRAAARRFASARPCALYDLTVIQFCHFVLIYLIIGRGGYDN